MMRILSFVAMPTSKRLDLRGKLGRLRGEGESIATDHRDSFAFLSSVVEYTWFIYRGEMVMVDYRGADYSDLSPRGF
jgi:hypothetical protein